MPKKQIFDAMCVTVSGVASWRTKCRRGGQIWQIPWILSNKYYAWQNDV